MRIEKRISVKVRPRSSQDLILGYDDDTGVLMINVKAAPVRNAANDAVVRLLSKALKIPQRKIRIVRGAKSRDKTIILEVNRAGLAKIKSL